MLFIALCRQQRRHKRSSFSRLIPKAYHFGLDPVWLINVVYSALGTDCSTKVTRYEGDST